VGPSPFLANQLIFMVFDVCECLGETQGDTHGKINSLY
jgi:hypothetical protein